MMTVTLSAYRPGCSAAYLGTSGAEVTGGSPEGFLIPSLLWGTSAVSFPSSIIQAKLVSLKTTAKFPGLILLSLFTYSLYNNSCHLFKIHTYKACHHPGHYFLIISHNNKNKIWIWCSLHGVTLGNLFKYISYCSSLVPSAQAILVFFLFLRKTCKNRIV